jgi:hypothetical protein
MKSKPTLITGFAFLLFSGILAYFLLKGNGTASDPLAGNAGSPRLWTSHKDNTSSTRSSRARTRDAETATHLVEQFGESRTRYARRITTHFVSVFEDMIEYNEMRNQALYLDASKSGRYDADKLEKLNPANAWNEKTAHATRNLSRIFFHRLELTDAQRELATPIIARLMQSRFDAVPQIIAEMRTRPEPLMEFFLHGDARARGVITEEEYQAATAHTRAMIETVTYSVSGRHNTADYTSPLGLVGEEAFLGQLSAVLNPEQQAQLAEMTKHQYVQPDAPTWSQPRMKFFSGIPVVELDRLSEMVASDHSFNDDVKQIYQRWIQEGKKEYVNY